MHAYDLILTITGSLGAALVFGNMDAVRALREEGIDAIDGDATRPETLEAAGITKAGSLILGSAGMANSVDVIRTARELNPHVRVLARAPYLRDVAPLREAGANSVYSGEGEVALAFIEDILDRLGATPEQIGPGTRARTRRVVSRSVAVSHLIGQCS
jgi:K+:H+ antiporter